MAKSRKTKKKNTPAGNILWIIAAVLVVIFAAWLVLGPGGQEELADLVEESGQQEEAAAETTDTETEDAAQSSEQAAEEQVEAKEFPVELEDGKLLVDSLFQFTGFNPDYGNEPGDNIAALLVTNQSLEHLTSATLTVTLPDGTATSFHMTDILPGASVMVFSAEHISKCHVLPSFVWAMVSTSP